MPTATAGAQRDHFQPRSIQWQLQQDWQVRFLFFLLPLFLIPGLLFLLFPYKRH